MGTGAHAAQQRLADDIALSRRELAVPILPTMIRGRGSEWLQTVSWSDRFAAANRDVFDGVPTAAQVGQGPVNDCGPLAALGAIAQTNGHALLRRVRVGSRAADIRLDQGRREAPLSIATALSLPVYLRPLRQSLEFSASMVDGAWWAPLFEKAIACATTDGYARLDLGMTAYGVARATRMLGAGPATLVLRPSSGDPTIWAEKLHATLAGSVTDEGSVPYRPFMMLIPQTNPGTPERDLVSQLGLIDHHWYWVTGYDAERRRVALAEPHGASFEPIPLKAAAQFVHSAVFGRSAAAIERASSPERLARAVIPTHIPRGGRISPEDALSVERETSLH